MSKSKRANPWRDAKPYPEPEKRRGGIKVSWHYYITEEAAKACAEAAKHNAVIAESLGYDFGYQSPGFIRRCGPNDWASEGLWEVCIP